MARQRLGQHFLRSSSILERIARSALSVSGNPLAIEIGPGQGALTRHLLPLFERVIAIEVDPPLVERLRSEFPAEPRLQVVHGDVLNIDLTQWRRAVVIGNLPYYVASPIIEKTLEMGALLERAVFLIQEEVANRLVARPGTRDYGYLTVRTQLLAKAEKLFTVLPGAFQPPPEVNSAVVRITPWPAPVAEAPAIRAFLARAFHQKRKTLRNNLAGAYPKQALASLPEGGLRAEQMPLEQLLSVYERLQGDSAVSRS